MRLETITVKKYHSLPFKSKNIGREDVDNIIKSGLAQNKELRIKGVVHSPKVDSLWQLKWKDKIELENYIKQSDLFSVMNLLYEIKESEFLLLNVFNCFAAFEWVQSELKAIAEWEEINLSREPSAEELQAGIEQISKFKYMPAMNSIHKTFGLSEEEIMELQYQSVVFRLSYIKVQSEIQQNLFENAKRKAKGNSGS